MPVIGWKHVILGNLPSGTEDALRRGAMMGDCFAVNTLLLSFTVLS